VDLRPRKEQMMSVFGFGRVNLLKVALAMAVMVAAMVVVSTAPSPALAGGATQISGIGVLDEGDTCDDPEGEGADFALIMTGDLEGCLYTFVETA